MKKLIFGACILAAAFATLPATAMPLPQAALQLPMPDITSTSITVSYDGTDLNANGTSVALNSTEFLFGLFSVQILGLQSDLSFTSGFLSITDTILGDGDQSLSSNSLVAVGTDNGQIQILFDSLAGAASPLFQATSPFALVLLNLPFAGIPNFEQPFADNVTGANADTAAILTPVPGTLPLMVAGIAAAAFAARRRSSPTRYKLA